MLASLLVAASLSASVPVLPQPPPLREWQARWLLSSHSVLSFGPLAPPSITVHECRRDTRYRITCRLTEVPGYLGTEEADVYYSTVIRRKYQFWIHDGSTSTTTRIL